MNRIDESLTFPSVGELRLFLAAQPGARLEWSITDPDGNSISTALNTPGNGNMDNGNMDNGTLVNNISNAQQAACIIPVTLSGL